LQLRFENPRSVVDHHVGVQTLMAYFHHSCRGISLRNMIDDPRVEQKVVKALNLTPRLQHFIKQSAERMKQKGANHHVNYATTLR
jgi:hypothetical protein